MSKKIDFILNAIGISFIIFWIVIDLIKHHNDLSSIISWLVIALAMSFAYNWRLHKRIKKLKSKNSYVYFTKNGMMVSTDREHWKYGINNIKEDVKKRCFNCQYGGSEDMTTCNKCFEITSKTGKARSLFASEKKDVSNE